MHQRLQKLRWKGGVAKEPIEDFDAYQDQLNRFVFRSGLIMKPIIELAGTDTKRVIFADGEDERVLRAAEIAMEDKLCQPILIGRPEVIETRLKRYGLSIRLARILKLLIHSKMTVTAIMWIRCSPSADVLALHRMLRAPLSVPVRQRLVQLPWCATTRTRLFVALRAVSSGICNISTKSLGANRGINSLHAMSLLIDQRRALFMTDTYISEDPNSAEIAEMTRLAAKEIERFGIKPKGALLSASDFGFSPHANGTNNARGSANSV